ncbi:MAG: hypothetical protein IKL68_06495 [Clostridia bacterium]|nr:hypothetical protein [Clostridia bacterium]
MEQETKKKKLHILDKIFVIASFVIPLLGMIGDYIMWYGVTEGGFPVCTILSIFPYGALVIALSIIATVKKSKTEFCKLWVILFIPWLFMGAILLELIIGVTLIWIFSSIINI